MGKGDHIIKYYLQRLAEYRKAGYSDGEAARAAEKDTLSKYGKLPKEGQ